MFKKIIAATAVALATLLCTSCGFASRLSEENINKFLKDSQDGISYMSIYEPESADKAEIDSDLKVRMAAAALAARSDYYDGMGSTFCIKAEDMEKEVADMFADADISDFTGNNYVYKDENGDYQLLNGDWGDAGPSFKITDSFYGLVGSEPTELTVHYTLSYEPDGSDMSDTYDYEVKYKLVGDKDSRYMFKVTDFKGQNLIPVEK